MAERQFAPAPDRPSAAARPAADGVRRPASGGGGFGGAAAPGVVPGELCGAASGVAAFEPAAAARPATSLIGTQHVLRRGCTPCWKRADRVVAVGRELVRRCGVAHHDRAQEHHQVGPRLRRGSRCGTGRRDTGMSPSSGTFGRVVGVLVLDQAAEHDDLAVVDDDVGSRSSACWSIGPAFDVPGATCATGSTTPGRSSSASCRSRRSAAGCAA